MTGRFQRYFYYFIVNSKEIIHIVMKLIINKILLCLYCILTLLSCNQEKSTPNQAVDPYASLTPCQPEGLEEEILCGTLMVDENRVKKNRKIPINIYLFPSTQPNPERKVFLEYNGGPASPNENLLFLYEKGGPSYYIRAFADILIIDQRGTGASEIPCAAYDDLQFSSHLFDLNLVKKCLEESQKSVDLSHYSTAASVEDIEAVRAWLNIPKLDISGLSYGTRTALEYMRRYPEKVGSMILTGTVSPSFGYARHLDFEIEKQLQTLIQRCEKDSACQKTFPDFGHSIYSLRDQLQVAPVTIGYTKSNGETINVFINDTIYVRMIGQLFLSGRNIEALPLLIHEFKNGNPKPLIKTNVQSSRRVMSLYLSQFCPDDIFNNPVNEEAYKDLFTYGEMGLMEVRACAEWLQLPSPDWLSKSLRGDAPVLLITGKMDTQTPPRMAEKVASVLKNSRHILLPQQGHALTAYDCWDHLVSQFLQSKNLQTIDTSCLQTLKRPNFKLSLN